MKEFATADWHLGEDRFKIMGRHGFYSQQHMVDEFVKYHNERVGANDKVYVVGDAVSLNAPEFLEQVSRFNGNKILFRGNHDRQFTDEDLKKYFVEIIPEGEGLEIEVDGIQCWLTHYPTQSKISHFNLVGHIHSAWRVQLNALNVGVDCNHYRPYNLHEDVPFYFKAICEFYDQDVWVAYHEYNANFIDTRGKSGRYLDQPGKIGG